VLHLLESAGSVTSDQYTYWRSETSGTVYVPGGREVYQQLADLGFASLVLVYEGVGASEGERSPENLRRDVLAAWREAVARAGSGARVVVRGTSIGTLGAALLLDAGERPAGLVLAAPVLADTVALHFGRERYGAVLTALAALVLSPVTDVDLDAALRAAPVPHAVWAHPLDELLSVEDELRLGLAVEIAGGRWHDLPWEPSKVRIPEGLPLPAHVLATAMARELLPGEDAFLQDLFPGIVPREDRIASLRMGLAPKIAARFPPGSPAEERLHHHAATRLGDDPGELAVVVLAGNDLETDLAFLDRFRARGAHWLVGHDFESRLRLLDMGDPAGPLPAKAVIESAGAFLTSAQHPSGRSEPVTVDDLLDLAAGCGAPGPEDERRTHAIHDENGLTFTRAFYPRRDWWNPARDGGRRSERDAARQVLRVLFKAAGMEDRVVADGDGWRLEIRDGDDWRVVDESIVLAPRSVPLEDEEATTTAGRRRPAGGVADEDGP